MSLANGRVVDAVFRACNDRRYKVEHFIITDISAEFLRRNGINMTVAAFKEIVRKVRPSFTTHTGNAKVAPLMKVKVYSIYDIKKIIEGGEKGEQKSI